MGRQGQGKSFRSNLFEVEGALGDLGTLLPLAIALIALNGMNTTSVFLVAGLCYIGAGIFYRLPMPVLPLKAAAAHSPRQGAGVIGWTAAIAAYGPFLFSVLIGASITGAGSAVPFFYGIAVYYVIATFINWWYYTRKGCEKPS